MGEARLDPRDKVVRPDLQNAVHPSQVVEADAAVDGYGVRLQAATLPERYDGYLMLVGKAQDLYHLIAALRIDNGVGPDRGVVGKDAAVALQLLLT